MKKTVTLYVLFFAIFYFCSQNIKEKDLDGIWSIQYIMKDSINILDYYNYTAGAVFTNPLYKFSQVSMPCRTKSVNRSQWQLNNDTIEFFNSEYGDFEGKYHIHFQDDTWRGEQHWLILKGDSIDLYFTESTFHNGPIDMNYYKKKID